VLLKVAVATAKFDLLNWRKHSTECDITSAEHLSKPEVRDRANSKKAVWQPALVEHPMGAPTQSRRRVEDI